MCVILCVYLSEYMHVQVSYRVRKNRENVNVCMRCVRARQDVCV